MRNLSPEVDNYRWMRHDDGMTATAFGPTVPASHIIADEPF